jgi:hypothetical protein
VPGVEKVTASTHPPPDDPAIIRDTAIALLDRVNNRPLTSSPRERTEFLGPVDRVEDNPYSPRWYTAFTNDDYVVQQTSPAGTSALDDQFNVLADQIQQQVACYTHDHFTKLTTDVTSANSSSIDAFQVTFL